MENEADREQLNTWPITPVRYFRGLLTGPARGGLLYLSIVAAVWTHAVSSVFLSLEYTEAEVRACGLFYTTQRYPNNLRCSPTHPHTHKRDTSEKIKTETSYSFFHCLTRLFKWNQVKRGPLTLQ